MKEKKNIDNIFNEGFKNFEATPSPRVWENIQTQLKKENEDRKVIPLWIKIGGVAALLAVLFSVGTWVYNPSDLGTPSITDENVQKTEEKLNENSKLEKEIKTDETQVAWEHAAWLDEGTQDLNASVRNSSKNKNGSRTSAGNNWNASVESSVTVTASRDSGRNDSKAEE